MIDGEKSYGEIPKTLLLPEPEIARIPIMIDSQNGKLLEAGLKCVQRKIYH